MFVHIDVQSFRANADSEIAQQVKRLDETGVNFESWERYNQRKLHNTMAAAADYVQIRYRGKKHTLERQRGAKQMRRDCGDPPGLDDYTVD